MPRVFLQNRIFFLVTLAVIATTVFSWFNLNSIFIMLLVLCRLLDGGPVRAVKAAFTNRYFIAYFTLFLVDAAGLLYTHNTGAGGHIVEKGATLVAIPFILCAGPFADERRYKQLMTAYCLILFLAALYCLLAAIPRYEENKYISAFFYHELSHAIHENAIYFSVFLIFGLLFLLSPSFSIDSGRISPRAKKGLRLFMILFFIGVIILLASKLLLAVLLLILIHFIFQKYNIRKNNTAQLLAGLAGLLLVAGVLFTQNPIKVRYLDIVEGNISVFRQDKFSPVFYFNGVQLRLLEWRYGLEILNEQHAWSFGVSPGDSQDLLDQKYIHANMYTGNPAKKNEKGYLTYNFHNQYMQYLVQSGILGLAVFLYLCGLLISVVWKWRTREAFFSVVILLTLFVTESFITLQHGVFLFSFFPLLLLYSPKKAPEEAKR